jgi:membrane protein implicated in regulation of membrane protease activity
MKKNVGTADKWIRIIIGLVLLSLVFFGPKTAWGWIGLIPLITAFVGFCPLYLPFKISTKKEEVKSQP